MLAALGLLVALPACGGGGGSGSGSGSGSRPDEGSTAEAAVDDSKLVVYSGRQKQLVQKLFDDFTTATGVPVSVRYGDSSELAAQLQEEGSRTDADLFFSQDAGALGALSAQQRLAALPQPVLDRVDARYRSDTGEWVGISGRSRVLAYDPRQVPAERLPTSVLDLTRPEWKGKVGYAPTNASLQAAVTALRVLRGEQVAEDWLRGLKSNEVKDYPNNVAVLDAVDRGEIAFGLINHYYWYEKVAELGEAKVNARIHYFTAGDPGALVNVAGAGVLRDADKPAEAQRLVEFLLGPDAQRYLAYTTFEYPLVPGSSAPSTLKPLAELSPPPVDLSDLASLGETLALLDEVGLT